MGMVRRVKSSPTIAEAARRVLVIVMTCAVAIVLAPIARAGEPLPPHDRAVDVTLENGLRIVMVPHETPPGRAVMRLIVHTGSLQERDEERGVAHFIQHMAFHGSRQFPAGSARRVFQALGMELDRHENAYTAFDHTAYTLNLPGVSEPVLSKGLAFLSDVLDGLTFPEPAIETERGVLLEELRQYDSPEQRVFRKVLPQLAPGSNLGDRFPAGDARAVESISRRMCADFYARWYTPGNATLLIVGDVQFESLRPIIEAQFAAIKNHPAPPSAGADVRPFDRHHAVVVTDPELVRGVVASVAVAPLAAPARTVSAFRDQLVDQLARQLIERRLDARAFNGDGAYAGSGVYIGNAYGALWIAQIVLAGPSERMPGMLVDLITELQRARRYGFTDAELQLARDTLLAEARSLAESETTLPAVTLAGLLTESIAADAPLISGAQNLALLQALLPAIPADRVSERFTQVFAPERTATLVEVGAGVDVPSEASVLAEAQRIAERPVREPKAPVVLDALMPSAPARADLDSVNLDAATGVLTMRFANGVLAHHRLMDERASSVTLRLTIAGGELEEDATTRGFTRAGAVVFDRPATQTLTGLTIRDFMSSRGLSIRSKVALDAITIEIDAPPDQIDAAFQLLHLAIIDPVIEAAALDDWRQRETARAIRRSMQPGGLVETALVSTIYPENEVRVRPLTPDLISDITVEEAQPWLRALLARAPLELSIVGDVARSDAADLASRYIGSLPARPMIDQKTLADRRVVQRAAPPYQRTIHTTTQSDQAVVAVGFIGPDADDAQDTRALDVAERVLRPHLIRKLRDELGLVGSVSTTNRPAQALPGFGLFLVIAPTSAEQSSLVADLIDREFEQLALGGPGLSDVALAQAQLATAAKEDLLDDEHWSRQLADLHYRGRSLGELTDAPTAHQSIDPSDIRQTLARRLAPDNRIRLIILPEQD